MPAGTPGRIGEREALLGALVRERGQALAGYAYLLTGSTADAHDLVQDALVRTVERLRGGAELTNAEGYVRRAILTRFLDTARRRQRWAGLRHLIGSSEAVPEPQQASAAHLDLRVALVMLPPQQRAAVVLRYYGDLSVAEVAEAMGLADGTVKRYLSMGTQRLRDLLGVAGDDPLADDHDADAATHATAAGTGGTDPDPAVDRRRGPAGPQIGDPR